MIKDRAWLFILVVLPVSWLVQYLLFTGIVSQKYLIVYMFIPALTAFVFFFFGKNPVKTQVKLFTNRTSLWAWVFAVLYSIVLLSIIVLIGSVTKLGNFNPDFLFKQALTLPFLSMMGLYLLMMLPSMFGEEYGWRGYLLPALTKNYSKLWATIILGVVWGMWHIPSYYIIYSKANIGNPILLTLAGIAAVAVGAFPYSYLFFMNGSILPVVLLHGMYDLCASRIFLGSPEIPGLAAASPGILMIEWPKAVVLIIITGTVFAYIFAKQFEGKGKRVKGKGKKGKGKK